MPGLQIRLSISLLLAMAAASAGAEPAREVTRLPISGMRGLELTRTGEYLIGAETDHVVIYNLAQKSVIARPLKDERGTRLASQPRRHSDATAVVWDGQSGKSAIPEWTVDNLNAHAKDGDVSWSVWRHAAAFSPDGTYLITIQQGSASVHDVRQGKVVSHLVSNEPLGTIGGVLVSPSGKRLLALPGGPYDLDIVELWELPSAKRILSLRRAYKTKNAAFGGTDDLVLLTGPRNDRSSPPSLGASLWDLRSSEPVVRLARAKQDTQDATTPTIAFSADGRLVAVGGEGSDETIVWSIK
jgi:WD40 repeat protein